MSTRQSNTTRTLSMTACALAVTALPAAAQGYSGWGPSVGVRMDPDQIYAGVHIDAGRIVDRLLYRPSARIGFSDDVTVLTLNAFEATYRFAEHWEAWSPYLGGAFGLVFTNYDNGAGRDHSDTDAGLAAIGGIERGLSNGDAFFIETRLGLVDQPDLSVGVGWSFH